MQVDTSKLSAEELEEFKKKAAALGFTLQPANKDKQKVDDDEEYNVLRGSGFYNKREVGFSKEYGDRLENKIKLREFADIDVDGAVVLAGFPSTSLASILTCGYLREQLKLPLVGVISSFGFPPRCIIEKGIPSHSVRIFGDRRLVVILCEFKIPSNELIHSLTDALIDFVERHKSPSLLTVEGVPISDPSDKKLRFISTDRDLSEKLIAEEHTPLDEAVVGGVTGALLAEGVLHSTTDVSCILTPTAEAFPDADSAVTVVKVVTNYLTSLGHKIEVDTTPLENKAGELHNTIKNLFANENSNRRASDAMYS